MIDLKNFTSAIAQIEEEKGIERGKILETVEMSIAAAYKKDYGKKGQIVKAKLDPETGGFDVWQEKIVVDESMIKTPEEIEKEMEEGASRSDDDARHEEEEGDEPKKVRFNEEKHIMLDEAKKIDKDAKPGDELRFDLEVKEDFGRIAAQTAKQVIIQRIREAEREAIYEEYESKIDSIISGIAQRIEGNTVFFDLGKATGIMPPKERIPTERYRIGQRLRLYLLDIERGPKGPQIYVSRSHPKMLSRLFELEVPEIGAGTVEIKSVAREPGARSKIAVASTEEGIDPIGSCVGQRGTRVSAVIQELGGEKIDIIEWKEGPEELIANSLSPAKILDVSVDKSRAKVTVSEDQLSLAIGKDGQNVRLAAKLTGWKIDIISKETGEVEQSVEDAEAVEAGAENKEEAGDASSGQSEDTKEAESKEGEAKKESGDKEEEPKEEEEPKKQEDAETKEEENEQQEEDSAKEEENKKEDAGDSDDAEKPAA